MEGLIILVAELLLLPFIAGITALCELVLSLASLLLQLVFGVSRKRPKESSEKKIKIPPALIRWMHRIAIGSVALFATALLLINFVFLEETVRFAADQVEEKTGFEIQYDAVEGNIFTGAFAFAGLDLKQTQADKPQLSVKVETLAANLSVWDFILGSRVIDSASLSHAEIALQTLPKAEEEKKSTLQFAISFGKKALDGVSVSKSSALLKAPNYTIKDLHINDVSIHVDDRSAARPTAYDIEIASFQAEPLRSHFAIFDLLFRSNLDAKLNGSRLLISNTESNGQRHTQWATQDVPASVLASLIGGPFSLFEKGSVDVEVTDQWEAEQVSNLELDWAIKVSDAQARLPVSTPELLKPLAQVWVDNINQNEEDWEFAFQLQLSEDQFKGASSLNAQQIWQDSLPVFIKQVTEKTGIEESTVKEKTTKALDAVKGFFERRNPKEK